MNKVNRVVTRVRGSDGWREEEEEDNNEGVQPKPEHVAAGTVGCRCRCSSRYFLFRTVSTVGQTWYFLKQMFHQNLYLDIIITFSWFSPLRREAFLARIQLKLKLKIRASTSSTTKPQLLLQQPSPPSRPLAATQQKYKNHT